MNLKKLLHSSDDHQLSSAEYRVEHQLRVRAGQALAFFSPFVAIGAVSDSPLLMIPGLFVPTAIALPVLAEKAHKVLTKSGIEFVMAIWLVLALVSQLARSVLVRLSGARHFWRDVITLAGGFSGAAIYEKFFASETQYEAQRWSTSQAGLFQAHHGWTLVVAGLAMTGVCAWLSHTFMKGRRTQSLQRIAAHLAAQEAEENA
ncbi:hypothetical protein HAP94_08485 [Acidithiobacillus ferrivorans]|nr:hypothetical protein [Acidithiobacillus ferrivorans]